MVLPAIHPGVLGYLIKDAQPLEVHAATHQVGSGNSYLPLAIALKLAQSFRRGLEDAPIEPLAERE
jgi:DNA-binding NarL/FixJ family response regulator